jgi:uncharacterized repeat protein (TIGR02543 family)
MPASNVSDTANSTAGTFYITYNANGGTGAPATQAFTFNAGQTISTTKPTRTGYTFVKWVSNPNSVDFAPGATIPAGWGSFELIAQWTPNNYHLDLNGYLDGVIQGNITGYGTCDIYINGSLVANDVTDYYTEWPYGTTYEIKDIKAATGHTYNGVQGGSISGTITSNHGVNLNFTKNVIKITLNANGGTGGTSVFYYKYGINTFYSDAACTNVITNITRPTKACHTYNTSKGFYGDGTSGGTNGERYVSYDSIVFASDLVTDIYKDATLKCDWTFTSHTYSNNCDTSCNGCGATRTITHTYSYTCDTTCNVCGAPRSASHSYPADDCNCTTAIKCSYGCGTVGTAAKSHNYSTVVTNATCTTTGTKKCSNTGCTVTTSIAALGHTTPADDGNCTTAIKCGRGCGTTVVAAKSHNYSTVVSNATCTATGTKKCSNTGCTATTSIAATGHSYSDTITDWQYNCASVCRYNKCTKCGNVINLVWATSVYGGDNHYGYFANTSSYAYCPWDHSDDNGMYDGEEYWDEYDYNVTGSSCPECGTWCSVSNVRGWEGGYPDECYFYVDFDCGCGESWSEDVSFTTQHNAAYDYHAVVDGSTYCCPDWHGEDESYDGGDGGMQWGDTDCGTTHTYSFACDNSCNNANCTQYRSTTHSYSVSCDTTCDLCGFYRPIAVSAHSLPYTCDTTCRNGCGYTRTASHSYPADDGNCTTAIKCSYGCGTVKTAAKSHTYDNDCDATCNNTGCTAGNRSASHNFVNGTCSKCGQVGCTTHTFGTVNYSWSSTCRSCTASATCTVCGEYVTETDSSTSSGNHGQYGKDYTAYFSTPGFGTQRCPDWHSCSCSTCTAGSGGSSGSGGTTCSHSNRTVTSYNGFADNDCSFEVYYECSNCGYSWMDDIAYESENPSNSAQYEHQAVYNGSSYRCRYWHNY